MVAPGDSTGAKNGIFPPPSSSPPCIRTVPWSRHLFSPTNMYTSVECGPPQPVNPSSLLPEALINQLRLTTPQPQTISTLHGYPFNPGSDSKEDEPEPEQHEPEPEQQEPEPEQYAPEPEQQESEPEQQESEPE